MTWTDMPDHPKMMDWYRIVTIDWELRHEPEPWQAKLLVSLSFRRNVFLQMIPECIQWHRDCIVAAHKDALVEFDRMFGSPCATVEEQGMKMMKMMEKKP